MLIRNAEVWRHGRADVRITDGRITAIGQIEPMGSEMVIDAKGGALLPGLHDHHIHLMASAVRAASVVCGPPDVTTADELAHRLAAPGTGWLRGILYHESVMGLPDAKMLDAMVPDRPLRMQHRSGRMWLLNSLALHLLLASAPAPAGLEVEHGRFTGRLFDEDGWLQQALGSSPPDLGETSAILAAHGVTGVTDMTPRNDPQQADLYAQQVRSGRLRQHCHLAGTLALGETAPSPFWRLGPAKLHLHEAALPDLDQTIAFIRQAHDQGRAVASHCTTETELVFTLAALAEAGPMAGDRIEHAGIARDEHIAEIAALGLAVVSQPQFITERGDRYLADVEPELHDALYRLQAFIQAGVPLAAGSDAPFASLDPWQSMAAAVSRQTTSGAIIGASEALSPEQALALFLSDADDLSRQRTIALGEVADLCLLRQPWSDLRDDLASAEVVVTLVDGRIVHQSIDQPKL